MVPWLREHKFETHLSAFLLMALSSSGMYFSMSGNSHMLTWLLVGLFAAANLLAMFAQ